MMVMIMLVKMMIMMMGMVMIIPLIGRQKSYNSLILSFPPPFLSKFDLTRAQNNQQQLADVVSKTARETLLDTKGFHAEQKHLELLACSGRYSERRPRVNAAKYLQQIHTTIPIDCSFLYIDYYARFCS